MGLLVRTILRYDIYRCSMWGLLELMFWEENNGGMATC